MTADIVVCGGGPGGLSAAISAASCDAHVTLIDRGARLGGQLVKQIHKFFGSEKQFAGTRGIDIAGRLIQRVNEKPNITVLLDTTVLGHYTDRTLLLERNGETSTLRYKKLIAATGASEKMALFEGNDLPGVFGAGAVQTLMNEYGVRPGTDAVVVGAGNIGLIVCYQMLQAGIQVKAIVEAAPRITGYLVHASKIRRCGVPILTSHEVQKVHGKECVVGITVAPGGTESDSPDAKVHFPVDLVCLAVGLSPLTELLWQGGCKLKYVPQLGGYAPLRDKYMRTSVSGIYAVGDAAGIEEACTAMVCGEIAGLAASRELLKSDRVVQGAAPPHQGITEEEVSERLNAARKTLSLLREGERGRPVREGIACVTRAKG